MLGNRNQITLESYVDGVLWCEKFLMTAMLSSLDISILGGYRRTAASDG